MTNPINITLVGWTHVHTWHESHGQYYTDIYQRDPLDGLHRRVELLEVSTYNSGLTGVRMDYDKSKDYLLARDIRANQARYVELNRYTEPCATAGYNDYRDTDTDKLYRIFGAAGHGEWAFEIQEEDLHPSVRAALKGGE